jgi:hypothetical protein
MRVKTKTLALWAVLVAGAVLLALVVSGPVQRKIHAQSEAVRPYTIQYHGLVTGAQGEAVPYDYLVAGRSDGNSMSKDLALNSPRHLELVASGLLVAVAPSGDNVVTMGRGTPITPRTFGDDCERYAGHTGETKTILGFRTVKVISTGRQVSVDGKNDARDTQESWLAPELNCQHLEQKITWTFNGRPNGVTTEIADWALAGEPDAALFALPENPVEVPPSVFYAALGEPYEPRMEAMYIKEKAERAALGLP